MAPGRHETERLARPALRFKPALELIKPANSTGLPPYASPPQTGSRLAAERCAGHGGRVLHLVGGAPPPRYVGVNDPHAGLPTDPGSALMGGTRLQMACH